MEIFLSVRGLDKLVICNLQLLCVGVIPDAVTIVMYFGATVCRTQVEKETVIFK